MGGGVPTNIEDYTPSSDVSALDKKWEGGTTRGDRTSRGTIRFFREEIVQIKNECEEFARDKIPEGQFQWFIEIVIYKQFVTFKTVSTAESQRDEVHTENLSNKREE